VVVLYAALSASVASWASLSHTPPAGLRAIRVPASVPLSDVHVPTAVSVPTNANPSASSVHLGGMRGGGSSGGSAALRAERASGAEGGSGGSGAEGGSPLVSNTWCVDNR